MATPNIHNLDINTSGPVDGLLERLAERVGARASASIVYGEPVERAGVTVIPVAKVRWGFGGGSGRNTAGGEARDGSGGGGGMTASPFGFIEIRDGHTAFKRIDDPATVLILVPPIVLAGGITTWLVLRGLTKLLHR